MKVLLVDDDDLVRRVVRVILEAEEVEVAEAGDADAAYAAAASSDPDVVVCDLMLPGTRGDEVCRTLKDHNAALKVLLLTSLPSDEAAPFIERAGADDFMEKPFSPLALLAKVQDLASHG